ncbi:MAG: HyaD/HybD family hydrogenase maturation endopeptidase [Actinomycetota bacterium]|nr:HyaD/HybD family hydrogenase maturation endopeptidase [Actinomycetota bacterium]
MDGAALSGAARYPFKGLEADVSEMSDCVVIGIGNLLMSDDGIGVHAVRYLRQRLTLDVELLEGGIYSPDLLYFLENRRKAVFIDGVDAGEEPGTIYRFSPHQVARGKTAPALSLHDYGLYDLLNAAILLDQCPEEVTIIAVQVKSLETGMELSGELRDRLPDIYRLVMEELDGSQRR